MSQAHYIEEPEIAKDLEKRIDANTPVEILIHPGPLALVSRKDDFRRRLTRIQLEPKTKIVAAIEFIKSSLVNLHLKDLQTRVFLSLFQGDNLSREIKINPKAIDHLFYWIETGIQYYQNQKSLDCTLFL